MKRKAVSLLENGQGGILIVDGGQAFHRKIVNLLADTGYRVEAATSGEMVLEEVQEKSYDVLLLDLRRSRSKGHRLLNRILKAQPWISVVMLAKDSSAEDRREALQRGAYLFLTQPISGETLDLVLRSSVERARLRAENSALKEKVVFDDLTQAYNRRYLELYLDEEIERSRRYRHPFSILFLDLDHLKEINDRYGHIYGSKVLRLVAILLRERLRKSDKIFRFGGDEFVVTLPETDSPRALLVAQRLSGTLRQHRIPVRRGIRAMITASFGIATYPSHGTCQEELIRHADEAMYQVKEAARNRGLSLDIQEQATELVQSD